MPGDDLARNDHTDHRRDDRVVDALAVLGRRLVPLDTALGDVLARFTGYAQRYSAAVERVERGEHGWVDGIGIDSCHTVWFELSTRICSPPSASSAATRAEAAGPTTCATLRSVAEAPVVVVGAGAAGLATAAALREHGRDVQVLERADRVGASWAGALRQPAPAHRALAVRPARAADPAALRQVGGARRPGAVPRDVRPQALARAGAGHHRDAHRPRRHRAGWLVRTDRGDRAASRVVLATGYSHTPRRPDWPGVETFPGDLRHSADYREPSAYAGQAVLVVGAGNSATEIALDLLRVGAEVTLSVRTPPNIVRRDTLGVPSQVFGIALKRVPERLMDPLTATLRRISVPDLTAHGLPAVARTRTRSSARPARCRSSTPASSTRCAPAGSGSCRPRCRSTDRPCTSPTAPPSARTRWSRRPGSPPGWSRWSGTSTSSTAAGVPTVHGADDLPGRPRAALRRHQGRAVRAAARDRARGRAGSVARWPPATDRLLRRQRPGVRPRQRCTQVRRSASSTTPAGSTSTQPFDGPRPMSKGRHRRLGQRLAPTSPGRAAPAARPASTPTAMLPATISAEAAEHLLLDHRGRRPARLRLAPAPAGQLRSS